MYLLIYSYFDTQSEKLIQSFYFNKSKKAVIEFLNYHLNNMSEFECFHYYFCNAKILIDGFYDEKL